jgi:hypothetical protein
MRHLRNPRLQYVSGRVFSLSSTPVILFVANKYLAAEVAQGLAVAFLLGPLALLAVSADPHRQFYAQRFGETRGPQHHFLGVYAGAIVLLTTLGGALMLVGALALTGSMLVALASLGYFVASQIQDESLRYRLFLEDFAGWGRIVIYQTLLQYLLFGVVFFAWPASGWAAASVAITTVSLGKVVPLVPDVHYILRHTANRWSLSHMTSLTRRSIRMLHERWLFWAIGILGAGVGYLDRLYALFVPKAVLPVFLLVVMCFSVVHMSVDFFYLSRHRVDFLRQVVSVDRALRSAAFVATFALGLGAATAMSAVALALSPHGAGFPVMYVVLIAVVQSAFSLTMIPREISYWMHPVGEIFRVELGFWVLTAIVSLVSWRLGLSLGTFLLLASAGVVVRLAFHVHLARTGSLRAPAAEEEAGIEFSGGVT